MLRTEYDILYKYIHTECCLRSAVTCLCTPPQPSSKAQTKSLFTCTQQISAISNEESIDCLIIIRFICKVWKQYQFSCCGELFLFTFMKLQSKRISCKRDCLISDITSQMYHPQYSCTCFN